MKYEKEKIILEDATIVAFLLLKGFQIYPFKRESGRVAFIIEGGNIESAIREIYNDEQVGIRDYIQALKTIRNQIFTIKYISPEVESEKSTA